MDFNVSNDTILISFCIVVCTTILVMSIYRAVNILRNIKLDVSVNSTPQIPNTYSHFTPSPAPSSAIGPMYEEYDANSLLIDIHSNRFQTETKLDNSIRDGKEEITDGSSTSNSLDAMRNLR